MRIIVSKEYSGFSCKPHFFFILFIKIDIHCHIPILSIKWMPYKSTSKCWFLNISDSWLIYNSSYFLIIRKFGYHPVTRSILIFNSIDCLPFFLKIIYIIYFFEILCISLGILSHLKAKTLQIFISILLSLYPSLVRTCVDLLIRIKQKYTLIGGSKVIST